MGSVTSRWSAGRFFMLVGIVFAFCSIGGGAQIGTGGLEVGYGASEEGDLFVGAARSDDGHNSTGAIKRIRGGVVETYCQAPSDGPDRWRTPYDVIVDSRGAVVFLSDLGRYSDARGVYALLRCSEGGRVPEKLAIFGADLNDSRGYPVPFPDLTVVRSVGGLHLARKTAVVIDDDIAGGKPKTAKEDVYELVIATPSESKSLRYRALSKEWEEGARVVSTPAYVSYGEVPDVTYYGGATYSALREMVGRDREPFRINVKGTIGSAYFGLDLGLFGGYSEVGGGLSQGSFADVARTSFVLDNVLDPNRDGGCPPGSISTATPAGSASGTYAVPTGFGLIAKHRQFGLVVTSNSTAAGTPYLTQFGGVLLDDNPFNDGQALFLRPELGCNAQRKLDFEPILDWWDPTATTATSNSVDQLVSATEGLFGTQKFAGKVVQIRPGDRLSTVASGLISPLGIAAYPANVPPGLNIAVVIRIDSPVNVLVTDGAGRRIGVDPSGVVVNDFGEFGYVGEPGEPRLLAIREPAAGPYRIDAFGTGHGPYGVHVYSIDTSQEEGQHIVTRGTASPGATSDHGFMLGEDRAVAFNAAPPAPPAPPAADALAPVTAVTVSSPANALGWHRSDATVALTATDEAGGSGVKEIVYSVAGPQSLAQTTTAGGQVSIPLNAEGDTTVSYFARDNAGNTEATKTLTLRIDTTPPAIAGTRAPLANAVGWNHTEVTASFTCSDALSGVEPGSVTTDTALSAEGANQSVTGTCRDLAGNQAAATVGGINIDKTLPVIAGTRAPLANAVGWNHTEVTASFTCSDALSGVEPGSVTLDTTLTAEGANQSVAGTCRDRAGNTGATTVGGINIDKTAPAVTCGATPALLWPPNHQMMDVSTTVNVADALSGPAGFVLGSATSNEPDLGVGDGNFPNDIQDWTIGTPDIRGRLRAERSGRGTGRIYSLGYEGADRAGNTATCVAPVSVPPNRGRR